jgi:hypothetical protein
MTNRWANPINNNILRDLEGAVLASGSVAFYEAGTSTPLAVYSDPELTISLGSFINADAFGLLPDFHLLAGTQYKMVAYDAVGGAGGAGAVKWTRDDVFGIDSGVDKSIKDIEAAISGFSTGANIIINGGCSARTLDADGVLITAPALTGSFLQGRCIGVRARISNATAGTQDIGYSVDVESGAFLSLSGITTSSGSATASVMFQAFSGSASKFVNRQAVFGCKVYHDLGITEDFTVTVAVLNARDNTSAYTNVASSTFSVGDSEWSDLSIVVDNMGNCSNGIVVILSSNIGTVSSKNIRFSSAQLEIGGVLSSFNEQYPKIVESSLNNVIDDGSVSTQKIATSAVTTNRLESGERMNSSNVQGILALAANQNLGTNGTAKIGNLVVKWGRAAQANNPSGRNVTFPNGAFPNNVYCIVATKHRDSSDANIQTNAAAVSNINLSGFNLNANDSGSSPEFGVFWVALGD